MSSWTHPICERCWIDQNATWEPAPKLSTDAQVLVDIRRPTLIVEPQIERCCFCSSPTIFGGYVRHDPNDLNCQGEH